MTDRMHRLAAMSLEQIEGDRWGDVPPGATFLVTRVTELRRVPIGELDVEEIRIMIGQSVGLPILVPRALAVLQQDPLAEGDFYPGDLLVAVARCYDEWSAHVDDAEAVMRCVVEGLDLEDPDCDESLLRDVARFRETPGPGSAGERATE